jgi:hypothetical protein
MRERRKSPRGLQLGPLPQGDGHPVVVLPAFLTSDWMTRGFRVWLKALSAMRRRAGAAASISGRARRR